MVRTLPSVGRFPMYSVKTARRTGAIIETSADIRYAPAQIPDAFMSTALLLHFLK